MMPTGRFVLVLALFQSPAVDAKCGVGPQIRLDIYGTSLSVLTPLEPQTDPFWGQTTQILSNMSPKRDCGHKR